MGVDILFEAALEAATNSEEEEDEDIEDRKTKIS